MKQDVSLLINGSYVTYEVRYEKDGIYMASLTKKSIYANHINLPNNIFITQVNGEWKSDDGPSFISQSIIHELEGRKGKKSAT